MRRDQLEHAIRTACQIIGRPEVIVLGSQAILGTFHEDELPIRATMSGEVDILPIADSNEETMRLADRIEGVAGEFSPFEELHGFSIDGVDLETSALPEGWRGWCLDKEDLCGAHLCALREKDQNFVSELLGAGLADSDVIATRLATLPEPYRPNAERAAEWLASWT